MGFLVLGEFGNSPPCMTHGRITLGQERALQILEENLLGGHPTVFQVALATVGFYALLRWGSRALAKEVKRVRRLL